MTSEEHPLDARLPAAEAAAAAISTSLVVTATVAYLWGRIGQIRPAVMLAVSVAALIAAFAYLRSERATSALSSSSSESKRQRAAADRVAKPLRSSRIGVTSSGAHRSDRRLFLAATAVFVGISACLAYFAWPTLLPPGGGPDLTHHLMLIDYIERTWRLPDASLVGMLAEMAHYTPALHLLAALTGSWIGRDGFHTVYPVVAFTVALKGVFILLIAARELPRDRNRLLFAFAAALLCLLPAEYFLGSFVHDSFLAQAAGELFAVAMWWAIVLWHARPSPLAAGLFAVTGIGALLTWPMWAGPPIVTLVAVAATQSTAAVRDRTRDLALALGPIALVAAGHAQGRLGWFAIAGGTGLALRPSADVFGWPFVGLSVAGVAMATLKRKGRVTLLLTLSVVVQSATLYLVAETRGAAVPYMAFTMMYLAIYPLAVLGAVGLWVGLAQVHALARTRWVGWPAALMMTIGVGVSLARFAMPVPIVSQDLHDAGRWARGNLDAACVDYLVPNHETMRWLHLAVLGNSRSTLRTANPATFDPKEATLRWIQPAGLPYAIADIPSLPRDVIDNVDELERFGDAAVVSRRGPSICADAQRLAGVAFLTP